MVSGVLVKTEAMVRAREMFYKAVVQAVLLYRRNIWVVRYVLMKFLEGSHYRISSIIVGKTAQQVGDEGWELPPVEDALEAAELLKVQEFVKRQQATIKQYIST